MKKTLIALAVLGSVAGVAQAQSAVTVYGKLDLGLQKVTGTPTSLEGNHQSRLGFKGTEDLGGGLNAIFQIETRFNADTGAVRAYSNAPGGSAVANPLFGGQSIVGLTGGFGTVKLGRTYNIVDGVAAGAADPFEGDGIADMHGLTTPRLSNTVTYVTPNISGFSASVQAQLSEVSGQKNGWGITGAYENGPISAGLGYQKLTATAPGAEQANVWGLNAAYAFGPAKVMLGYERLDTKVAGAEKTKNIILGATYGIGAGLIKAAYSQQKTTDTDRKYALGYQHNLSKRTSVYADVAHTNPGAAGAESINGVEVGVTHNF